MSQADLAERMAELGTPWKRATVVNLEKRGTASRGTGVGRDAVTLQEWLHLAEALNAPPPLLLADPRRGEPVPVAEGRTQDPWRVLLWLVGSGALTGEIASHPRSSTATDLIWCGRVVAEVAGLVERMPVEMIDQWRTRGVSHLQVTDGVEREDVTRRTVDDLHRQSLEEMRVALERIGELGAPLPQVSEKVRKRAAELDVELPGQDGEG